MNFEASKPCVLVVLEKLETPFGTKELNRNDDNDNDLQIATQNVPTNFTVHLFLEQFGDQHREFLQLAATCKTQKS